MASRNSPILDNSSTTSNMLTSHAPIRRNLFGQQPRFVSHSQSQSQASRTLSQDQSSHARNNNHPRRPVQSIIPQQDAPASTATATPTPTGRITSGGSSAVGQGPTSLDGAEDVTEEEDDDIVVRDAQGNITLDGFDNVTVSAMSVMMKGPGGLGAGVAGLGLSGAGDDDEDGEDDADEDIMDGTGLSARKVDTKLIELYRSHSRQPIDQNELKAQVEASLRAKVASLDDDKWMYEEEPEDHET